MSKAAKVLVARIVVALAGAWVTFSTARELHALGASTGLLIICLLPLAWTFATAANDAGRWMAALSRRKSAPQD